MPQLDKVTFLSQFFWLCIVFFSLYLLLVKFSLPSLARIVQVRHAISNRVEENESIESTHSASLTNPVYNNCIGTSLTALETRTQALSDFMKTRLLAMPGVQNKFKSDVTSLQERALVSEVTFCNVASPLVREFKSANNVILNKFMTKLLKKNITKVRKLPEPTLPKPKKGKNKKK